MGYRKKTANVLLRELHDFLTIQHPKMHNSEAEPIVDMMYDADVLSNSEAEAEDNWNVTKMKLQKMIRKSSLAYGEMSEYLKTTFFESPCIRVEIFKKNGTLPYLYLPRCSSNETECYSQSFTVGLKTLEQIYGNTTFTVVTVHFKCLHLSLADDEFE
ncbi:hypothetical protein CEXT_41252, partial [Caerostris extrusa]